MSSVIGITQHFRKHKKCKCTGNDGTITISCPTVIQAYDHFTGTKITSPLDLTKHHNLQITEQGIILLEGADKDFIIDYANNKFIFFQEIEDLDVKITYFDVCSDTAIEKELLLPFPNIEAAKAAGLTIGDSFYLTEDNTASMYRQIVVYIAQ